jgi:UDP-3-O-[3-hydroxymyristoyl] glucosamine N-acyltransferase
MQHFIKNNVRLHDILQLIQATNQDIDNSTIIGVSTVHDLDEGLIACLHNHHYVEKIPEHGRGIIITKPEWDHYIPLGYQKILINTPYRAFAAILSHFFKKETTGMVSPTASISPTANIGSNVFIGEFCVIGDHAVIGDHTYIGHHTVIESDVKIGHNCHIESQVSIQCAEIGSFVTIKNGARIGQGGFGFDMDEKGPIDVPQLGSVIIQDHVTIGANTTIDRGSLENTIIGKGTRIDNLVQIAHNVVLKDRCIIVAQVGIAGSTQLGEGVIAAGQAGITGHLKIGKGCKIAAQSGVIKNLADFSVVGGSPSLPSQKWLKINAILKKMVSS